MYASEVSCSSNSILQKALKDQENDEADQNRSDRHIIDTPQMLVNIS